MNNSIKSQVFYNFRRSTDNLECMKWWFLIVNKNREIADIENRIYSLFAPIEEESLSFEGTIPHSGLRYRLISFDSRKKVEKHELGKIHKRTKRDNSLYDRRAINGLEDYVVKRLENN